MIDIHCHIVPNTDDGARNEEDSLAMGIAAQNAGYDTIIATSHYIIHDIENEYDVYRENIKKLNELYKQNGINVTVYNGNEIFFTNDIIKLVEDKKVSTLADSRYVLFELPLFNKIIPMNVYDEINLLQDAGYIPILAHPERYEFVQNDINALIGLIEAGVLLQSNIGSVYGKYGKKVQKTIKKMLKRDMVHFLATDSHNTHTYENMELAKKKLKKILKDEEKLDRIISNSEKIIKNEKINIWYPKEK